MTKPIVLASGSPRRRELLKQIGFDFTVMVSDREEKKQGLSPAGLVEELSRQKAEDIAGRVPAGTLVIGADTTVAVDGETLGKPQTPEEAVSMLTRLAGRSHQVYTGVTIVEKGEDGNREVTFSEETLIHLYPMTKEEIASYVATGDPMDKAGAYGIQGAFAAHVKGIEGCFYNVMGLPVGRLYQEMKAFL